MIKLTVTQVITPNTLVLLLFGVAKLCTMRQRHFTLAGHTKTQRSFCLLSLGTAAVPGITTANVVFSPTFLNGLSRKTLTTPHNCKLSATLQNALPCKTFLWHSRVCLIYMCWRCRWWFKWVSSCNWNSFGYLRTEFLSHCVFSVYFANKCFSIFKENPKFLFKKL